MRSCWEFLPEERPEFAELVESIDSLKSVPHKVEENKYVDQCK